MFEYIFIFLKGRNNSINFLKKQRQDNTLYCPNASPPKKIKSQRKNIITIHSPITINNKKVTTAAATKKLQRKTQIQNNLKPSLNQ